MRDNVGDMYPTIKMKKVRGLCPLTTSFTREVCKMSTENSLAHTKWECKYHIVFAPKYRRQEAGNL